MSESVTSVVYRPPGVEGFLLISALISLKYWLQSGIINTIHPAALLIFTAIVLMSFLMEKAFCSWMCPVGTVSESLWVFGERIFGRNLFLPNWTDHPLRSLKCLVPGFFIYAIGSMDLDSLRTFIETHSAEWLM